MARSWWTWSAAAWWTCSQTARLSLSSGRRSRTRGTLASWLQQRPGIAVVARDRSTEYARGIALGAPEAVQVCDRWHLLANMRQAVERWLRGAHARLQRLPMPSAGMEEATAVPVRRDRAFRRSGPERAASAASRARRRARYNEVRRRHLAGEPLFAIARATGLARATVRKYARAESFPEWAAHGPRRSILDPYLPYLERREVGSADHASSRSLRDGRRLRERSGALA